MPALVSILNVTRLLVLASLLSAHLTASGAEFHRATRLGNPETRFAPTLTSVEDLRKLFASEKLRADMREVLRQWEWQGDPQDMFNAAARETIEDRAIPVGTTLPFMSSRENGRPICLRNVLWDGKEPAPAFVFYFESKGRRYRCVTPKACSNFLVIDQGPVAKPGLAVDCSAPAQAFPGRPFQICVTVRNPGTAAVQGTARLRLPAGAHVISMTENGVQAGNEISWGVGSLDPKGSQEFCAKVTMDAPAQAGFAASATATGVPQATSSCATTVIGIPAILIDAVDLSDPNQVGEEITYEIKVTNQGSAQATNVKLAFIIPAEQEFIAGSGATRVLTGREGVATEPLPILAPKGEASWRVVVKAVKTGDVRFQIKLSSDQFQKPIHEEESTLIY